MAYITVYKNDADAAHRMMIFTNIGFVFYDGVKVEGSIYPAALNSFNPAEKSIKNQPYFSSVFKLFLFVELRKHAKHQRLPFFTGTCALHHTLYIVHTLTLSSRKGCIRSQTYRHHTG